MADEGRARGESVFLSSLAKSGDEHFNDKDDITTRPIRSTYALYKYEKKSEEQEFEANASVTNGTESLLKQKSLSLNLLTTSLDATDESLLLKFLIRKLLKNSSEAGRGHIASVELCLGDVETSLYLCYYCVLRQKSSSPATSKTAVTADDLACLGLDDLDLPDIKPEDASSDSPDSFVVCLIAPIESQLDLFKADLDKFSANLLDKLDFEIFLLLDLEETNETSDVVSIARPLLETWYTNTTNFLSNCVRRLGADVKYLVHAALTDNNIEVDCTDKEFKNDLRRFFECCSLSDLLSNNQSEASSSSRDTTPDSAADLLVDLMGETSISSPGPASSQHRIKVTVRIKVTTTGQVEFENQDCSRFCEDWGQALVNCDHDNVSVLRQVIESYKLKAIQDMNTLKRLLKQAESDHYSLYRCYMFLKQCGHGAILLQHADQEMSHSDSRATTQVLGVLHEYIQQSGGLMVR